jgi:hypothetical protein
MGSLASFIGPTPWLRYGFVDAHLQDDEDLQREMDQETQNVFFASWSRLFIQSKLQFTIEQSILAKKFYDIDVAGDPWNLNIDHKRYYYWPDCPY